MSTLKTTNIAHPSSASNNIVLDSSGNVVLQAGSASTPALQPSGDTNTGIFFPAADTIAFAEGGAEAARIDSSGRLLVGTSTSASTGDAQYAKLQVKGNTFSSAEWGTLAILSDNLATSGLSNNNLVGGITFADAIGSRFCAINAAVDGTPGANDYPGRLVFSTTADGASSPTERVRISNTGAFSTFCASGAQGITARTAEGAATNNSLFAGRYSATSTTDGTASFLVYTNGNVQNTNNSYAGISDAKLKENIVDAGSQWNDLKAFQVRKFNFKEGQTHTQIGLIAQEVELVSPGLVTESPDRDAEGNDLGTVTKSVNYSVLYMKAVKALQEAMERIEQLETEMAEVKAQLQAS